MDGNEPHSGNSKEKSPTVVNNITPLGEVKSIVDDTIKVSNKYSVLDSDWAAEEFNDWPKATVPRQELWEGEDAEVITKENWDDSDEEIEDVTIVESKEESLVTSKSQVTTNNDTAMAVADNGISGQDGEHDIQDEGVQNGSEEN